jgi:hypothetical protein
MTHTTRPALCPKHAGEGNEYEACICDTTRPALTEPATEARTRALDALRRLDEMVVVPGKRGYGERRWLAAAIAFVNVHHDTIKAALEAEAGAAAVQREREALRELLAHHDQQECIDPDDCIYAKARRVLNGTS